jgi:uncharacterized membrane protein
MNFDRKLARWVEAGLIEPAARDRILAFEHAQRSPLAMYGLAALGGATVALGFVSLIASNWERIPGPAKLVGDLLIGLALAVGTYAAIRRRADGLAGAGWASEVLLTLFYGYTLGSLALVGQVYQLGTPTYQGLLVWSGATLPMMLLGRSRQLATLVCAGVFTTHGFALEALFDALEHGSEPLARNLIASLLFVTPFLYIALARIPWLVRERPEYARTLGGYAWLMLLAAGFVLQFCWYDSLSADDTISWGLLSGALIAAACVLALPRAYPELPAGVRRTLAIIVGFGWLSFAVGLGVPHASADFVGALLQLAWLGLFAWLSLQLGLRREWTTLSGLIALRILAIYIEVFGSLFDTGLGLIIGGALTLLLGWYWRRKSRALAERGTGDHVA